MITTLGRRIDGAGVISGLAGLACWLGLAAGTPALAEVQTEPMIAGYAANLNDRSGTPLPLISAPLPVSLQLAGMAQKRPLDFDNLGVHTATMQHLGVSLGVDVTPWLTVRGLLGSSEFKAGVENAGKIGSGLEWGVDGEARLMNWHVEPMMCNVSWIHFDASGRYLYARAESDGDEAQWMEGYGDLTVSLVTVPDNKQDTVHSVSVYAGPAVSWIDGELDLGGGRSSDFSHDQLAGFTGGIVVVPHANIKLKLAAKIFDEVSYEGVIEFHF
jgi:hypothetical protein